MVMGSFERIMTSCPFNSRTTTITKGAHRNPRLRILYFADTPTLLALRLVSRSFYRWVKHEEHRCFRELHLTLNLNADYHVVGPDRFAALSRLGSAIATRMTITLLVPCRWQQKVRFKPRNDTNKTPFNGDNPSSKDIPILPAVFEQIEGGLFRKMLESMPKLTCLFIRDRVLSIANSAPEDEWGLTLVDRALIFLRAQIEEAHTDRIERRIKLEEDLLTHETVLNLPFAKIIADPQRHLEEIVHLAQALKLDDIPHMFRNISRGVEPRIRRPQLERWLMSHPGLSSLTPEAHMELSALTAFTKVQLESCLGISEAILQEDMANLSRTVVGLATYAPRWQEIMNQLDTFYRRVPPSKLLERLEFFVELAESPSKRRQILSHLDVPLPPGPLPPPVDRKELQHLSKPPTLFSFQLELCTPLALWHFRATRRLDGTISSWPNTITSLHLALPSPTPGFTRPQRGLVKRSYHRILAEFAPSLETLCIKFLPHDTSIRLDARRRSDSNPSFRGERASPECPLVYGCGDLDFLSTTATGANGGGVPQLAFPRLKRLGLINTTLRWEGNGGMKELLVEKAPKCITLHFTNVVFGGAESTSGWRGVYQLFMLDNPGWRGKFGWVMTRKFGDPAV